MSLLEQDTIRKRRVDENVTRLEFKVSDSEEYKVEAIWESAVYKRDSKSSQLPGFYYLLLWKSYHEIENIWERSSAVQHLRKMISSFYKNHSEKPTTTSTSIDMTLTMARPIVRPIEPAKQKRDRPAKNGANKRAKKS